MKESTKWLLFVVVLLVIGYWLYRQGEKRERFRILVAARAWLRAEKLKLDAWVTDQKQHRAEQADTGAIETKSNVVLGFQQPAV